MDLLVVDEEQQCGCCELGEYDGDPDSLEPWCKTCDHSPEEHDDDEAEV